VITRIETSTSPMGYSMMEDPVYEAVFANSMPKIHTAFYEKA
jgi:hypothetical protein